MFGDQPGNAVEAKRRGYGIPIPIFELTEEKLSDAIDKILTDPSYSEKAIEFGTIVTDQITKPLDRAVWWIEYAMRHPGMKHMRSPVHDLHWTQYFLLDVFGFLLIMISALLAILYKILSCLLRHCCSKKPKTD